MKIKVVVSVSMNGQSQTSKNCLLDYYLKPKTTSKNKVMTIAATLPDVEKVSVEVEKNLLTVIGERIDAVELVNLLRKKVGYATIVNQGPEPVEIKKEKPKEEKEEIVINRGIPIVEMWEVRDPYYNNSCFPFWW
ncbi:unnamed protein product [Withania somnifera]